MSDCFREVLDYWTCRLPIPCHDLMVRSLEASVSEPSASTLKCRLRCSFASTRFLQSVFCPLSCWCCDMNGFYKGTALWLLNLCTNLVASVTLNACIALKSKWNKKKNGGTLMAYCSFLKYTLQMYAMGNEAAGTDANKLHFSQLPSMLSTKFA